MITSHENQQSDSRWQQNYSHEWLKTGKPPGTPNIMSVCDECVSSPFQQNHLKNYRKNSRSSISRRPATTLKIRFHHRLIAKTQLSRSYSQNFEIRDINDVLVLRHERQTSPDKSLAQRLFSRQKHGNRSATWSRAQAFIPLEMTIVTTFTLFSH